MRRHGWQRPLHPLQIVAMAIFTFLVAAFYFLLGLFLGNTSAEIVVTTMFSVVVLSVMFLFTRCTAIDPTDKTSVRKKRKVKPKSKSISKLNYGFIFSQIVLRLFRRIERRILKSFIRRKYLDPWKPLLGPQMEPLLPFPLVSKDDVVVPDQNDDDEVTFCSLCNFEVKTRSKHCRTCNRCVEGFDHHCRWLNNCVGKRNYTTFFLLMISVLLMLTIEGGTAIAIFVRCFADKKGIEMDLKRKLHIDFPREALATITVFLVLMTAYGSAALGQLFFFHVLLVQKGMRTYDYILAMKEERQSIIEDPFEDSDFSSDDEDSSDFDSPEKKPTYVSRFIMCRGRQVKEDSTKLSIKIEADPQPSTSGKQGLRRISIDPWKLITVSRDQAILAAEKARERLQKLKHTPGSNYPMKPLPLETKSGLLLNVTASSNDESESSGCCASSKGISGTVSKSPKSFSSPRRRFSGSATTASPKHKYRSSFDLRKLTEVSRELETYISRQVLCSIIKKEGNVASPR